VNELVWLPVLLVAVAALIDARAARRMRAAPSPNDPVAPPEPPPAGVLVEFTAEDVLLSYGRFRHTCVAWDDLARVVSVLATHRTGDFVLRGNRTERDRGSVVGIYIHEAHVAALHADLARALHAFEGRGRAPLRALRAVNGGKSVHS